MTITMVTLMSMKPVVSAGQSATHFEIIQLPLTSTMISFATQWTRIEMEILMKTQTMHSQMILLNGPILMLMA